MKSARPIALFVLAAMSVIASAPANAQRHNPQATIAAQQAAFEPLAMLDGQWRGPATMTMPDGTIHKFTQTERIGPLLDGSIKLIEGRAYDDAGNTVFNAFAVLSFDPAKQAYTMHSHARGMVNDFAFTPTDDGFRWEIPAGPMTIRYTATIDGDSFVEIGERIVEGQPPVRFFEMRLARIGDSAWPTAGAVAPK